MTDKLYFLQKYMQAYLFAISQIKFGHITSRHAKNHRKKTKILMYDTVTVLTPYAYVDADTT